MSFLVSVAAFIVAIGVLVTVHEFGHYWVARRLGVKVLRFSVGFGKPIWKRVAGPDRTEYVVAAVPLGGYVKMLDEREADVPAAELERAFNRKPVGSRIAIVIAGPLFNFLFAIAAYAAMYMVGLEGVRPYVGEVIAESPAERAGLRTQDRITAVGEEPVRTWEEVRLALLDQGLKQESLVLELTAPDGVVRLTEIDLEGRKLLKEEGDFVEALGIRPWRPVTPQIVEVEPGGAAERAGLEAGDLIVAVEGEPVRSVTEWIDIVQARRGEGLAIRIERDGAASDVVLVPEDKIVDGKIVGFINARMGGFMSESVREQLRVTVHHGPLEALGRGLTRTWEMTGLTLRVLGKLIVGDASVKNISGPIGIAEYAGISATIGLAAFLSFMAAVSVSLGVLNLLPVPILDGGHLLYYLLELIKGSPLSEHAQALGQRVGLALLAALMLLAIFNDITRLFG
ncbi:MAG: RIP metalloprotease RseP [Chromatiales bacterium]|jgi:regulator of sigma E protease